MSVDPICPDCCGSGVYCVSIYEPRYFWMTGLYHAFVGHDKLPCKKCAGCGRIKVTND